MNFIPHDFEWKYNVGYITRDVKNKYQILGKTHGKTPLVVYDGDAIIKDDVHQVHEAFVSAGRIYCIAEVKDRQYNQMGYIDKNHFVKLYSHRTGTEYKGHISVESKDGSVVLLNCKSPKGGYYLDFYKDKEVKLSIPFPESGIDEPSGNLGKVMGEFFVFAHQDYRDAGNIVCGRFNFTEKNFVWKNLARSKVYGINFISEDRVAVATSALGGEVSFGITVLELNKKAETKYLYYSHHEGEYKEGFATHDGHLIVITDKGIINIHGVDSKPIEFAKGDFGDIISGCLSCDNYVCSVLTTKGIMEIDL
jgi:hypothetical protein